MSEQNCPLCNSTHVERIDRVFTDDIVALYDQVLTVDVKEYFSDTEFLEYYRCKECGLFSFIPSIVGDSLFYQRLNMFDWYYLPEKYEFKYCSQHIPLGARVLDIGCGAGAFKGSLPGRDYVGLEPHGESDPVSKESVLHMDIDQFLATQPELFDAVCVFQVLEHLKSPGDFIQRALSCLKPGGIFVVSTPSQDSFIGNVTNSPLAMPPHHMSHWPDSAFRQMTRFNLELEELHHEPLQDIHVPWFSSKFCEEQLKEQHPEGCKGGLIDMSPGFKALAEEAEKMAKQVSPIFSNPAWRPVGHTVIAVFTKKIVAGSVEA